MKQEHVRGIINMYRTALDEVSQPLTPDQVYALEGILFRELAPVDFMSIVGEQPLDMAIFRSDGIKANITKALTALYEFSKKDVKEPITNKEALSLYSLALSVAGKSNHLGHSFGLSRTTRFGLGGLIVLEKYLHQKRMIEKKVYS
ncbi:MAG TPA: hypothetical protein VKE88_01135 [Candidatus Nanoarchaeia archaeon]|nr:hypothetical protein [Candidatus Nanoarchaeia archaeon]